MPRAARRAKASALATERDQLVVAAVVAAQTQKAVSQDAAFEEGVEFREAPEVVTLVGSSIMMSSGSPISARHSVSICCSPPLGTPASVCWRSFKLGNMPYMTSKPRREVFAPDFCPSSNFWCTVSVGKISRFSGP